MNFSIMFFGVYVPITAILIIWVGQVLRKNGVVYLRDAFPDQSDLAEATNNLLVVGFHLLTLGWGLLFASNVYGLRSVEELTRVTVNRTGVLLLTLGAIHLFNMFVFTRIRNRGRVQQEIMMRRHAASLPESPLAAMYGGNR